MCSVTNTPPVVYRNDLNEDAQITGDALEEPAPAPAPAPVRRAMRPVRKSTGGAATQKEQLEYGENGPEIAADNMAAAVDEMVNPVVCEFVDEGSFYRAVGNTERFTGHGVVRNSDGSVAYRGQFDDGDFHGHCEELQLEGRGTYRGAVFGGHPCGKGVLTRADGTEDSSDWFDETGNALHGCKGYDKDADPGYQKFTLRFELADEHG
jgi:hypothetical protein